MAYGLPSRQTVNTTAGRLRASDVRAGDTLWTLNEGRSTQTTVTDVVVVKARSAVEVVTDHVSFTVSPDHLLVTPDGWVHAGDAKDTVVAWTPARKLCRKRVCIQPGYEFGYFVGATCADGTVGTNYVSLVVNDEAFAARYARCLTVATALPARLEAVTRPSGYLGRDAPGFRVRVVSSYLADLLRQYTGGDAHHMRQRFPRVVLRDQRVFEGFLDGYVDGDGCRSKHWQGRIVVSANVPFLADLANIIGARFTPRTDGKASRLTIMDSWRTRRPFQPEQHPLELREAEWVAVNDIRPRTAEGKPLTMYSYRLSPHPTFLVNGHVVREPW
ncbi:hypothetical protein ACFT5C_06740 [Streptomyces sp. NPDC057116]|uniref:hypothetical protein n=1 Tax=Streptomyces sp. NPDC057116 TaxID=3346023 RepID=UPI0036319E93